MNAIPDYIVVGLCALFVVGSTVLIFAACMLASKLSKKGVE